MGSVPSVTSPEAVQVNLNPSYTVNFGSEELKPCEKCNSDSVDSVYCDQCKQTLCSKCCQHNADLERKDTNPYYGKELIVVSLGKIPISSRTAKYMKVRSLTLAEHGKLAFISQLFYEDKKCKCCDTTSDWKLCFMENKPKTISDRLHKDQEFIHPGDLCYSEIKKKIYVTMPCQKKVYKIAASDSMLRGTSYDNFHEAFSTPLGSCFGITTFDNGLALSVRNSTEFKNIAEWQIHYVDFYGKIKQRVQNDANGKPLFAGPHFLTSNRVGTTLFVSDFEKNAVIALNTNGNVLFEQSDVLLKSPRGIAVDCYNNIYMACDTKLIQMDSSSKTAREILTVKNKNAIMSVCFDYNTRVLWTVQECGTVTSFYFQDDKHKIMNNNQVQQELGDPWNTCVTCSLKEA